MPGQEHQGTFTVTMLAVLRQPFEEWLASRGLIMGPIPETDALIVVPGPELHARELDERLYGPGPAITAEEFAAFDKALRSCRGEDDSG